MNPVEHESNIDSIEESMIYDLVFSENYASSTWCLDELTKILDCKKRYGRVVIPVFYKVDPSIVRNQRETYAEAFVKHEHRFQDKFDKVHGWKAALTEAAGLSGWDSQVTRSLIITCSFEFFRLLLIYLDAKIVLISPLIK